MRKTPYIGNTVFSFNYAFAPAYIAWYKAACEQGLDQSQMEKLLWGMNERIFSLIPKSASKWYINGYLNNFRKKAPAQEKLSWNGGIHPYDYKIRFRDIRACSIIPKDSVISTKS